MCIYISIVFGNCVCNRGVRDLAAPRNPRPGVDLNLKGLVFGPSVAPLPGVRARVGAPCWVLNVRRGASKSTTDTHTPIFPRSRTATNWGAPGSPRPRREQPRQPFADMFPYFFFIFLRRLKRVALFSCLYPNDGYFCTQCEYPRPDLAWCPPHSAAGPFPLLSCPLSATRAS